MANYTYTNDQNRYLSQLEYGNQDMVQYTYDNLGRVVLETYEDGSTVAYAYDNNGALATVTDSETGIKTTYYYDFLDRPMKYVEKGTGYSHSVGYEYDTLNNLTHLVETINGVKHTTEYTYDEDNRLTHLLKDDVHVDYDYDPFGRIETVESYAFSGSSGYVDRYYYYTPFGSGTTNQITSIWADSPTASVFFDFGYDDNGNLTNVEYGAYDIEYFYDSANQLIRENNNVANKTWTWEYDDAGNILCRKEYAYTYGTLGTPLDTVIYAYTDPDWGDLLTSYDGRTIYYDEVGNPTLDGEWVYTWKHGRQLASLFNGTTHINFTYDANGMRKTKTAGATTYTYIYNGSQLTQMTRGTDVLDFYYDASGIPVALKYDDTIYYYLTTLQGDVLLILDEDGEIVVSYDYDAWGKILAIGGSMATTLGTLNPLTYRGYVYDHETGLYYLQSRYYNPQWGRFINADAFVSTGGLLGNNMFAYCGNNPINCEDPSGNCWRIILSSLKMVEAVKLIAKSVCNLIKENSESKNNSHTIPAGGETVYRGQVRICTDGSDGSLVPDDSWSDMTAHRHNGKYLDAYTVYYIVMPLDEDTMLLGTSALLINHDTGMSVWCVVGEMGPAQNGWGEVSIAAIWDTGNPDHMTANSAYGLSNNYEIILYRDRKYDFGD